MGKTMTATEMERIVREAEEAGEAAMEATRPTPMIVGTPQDLLDANSPIDYTQKTYYVPQGMCGFAWVNVRPGTSRFAKYLKSQGLGRTDSYYGGVTVWVRAGGQSFELKEAYARAYAGVLQAHGIKATSHSRLD